MKIAKIYCDGACNNKLDKPAMGMGVAVYINEEYQEELSRAFKIEPEVREEKLTSNVAEWFAAMEGMKIAADLIKDVHLIFVYSDSQVITSQFNGDYAIRKEEFEEYFKVAHTYAQIAGVSKMTWIPREENTKADELSKIGLHGEDHYTKKRRVVSK